MAASPPISPSHSARTLPSLENGDHLDQPMFHARYESMPERFRAKLIGGVVYVQSPLKADHGEISAKAIYWLGMYQIKTPGTRVLGSTTVILGRDSEPQPDGCLIIKGGQTRVDADGYLKGPPELVVEIASSSNALDLFEKRRDYEHYGVREYLVLVVREARALWIARVPGNPGFTDIAPGGDGVLRSPSLPGLWLDAPALFRGDVGRVIDVLNAGLATPEHAAFIARNRQ